MTAWTDDMFADTTRAVVILKAIRTADYSYNVPTVPQGQTNPDGARYERVAHLPGMQEPDVTAWVDRHATDDVHVLVAFARGMEKGQVAWDARYEIAVSRSERDEIRKEANAELAEVLRTIPGARYDHLV